MKKALVAATLPALLIASTPSDAAQAFHEMGATSMRSAAFVGAHVRLGLGRSKSLRPVARLAAGMTHMNVDHAHGHSLGIFGRSTVELGIGRQGRADFYVAGQRLPDVQHRLGIAPGAVALLAIAGAAGAAVAVSAGGAAAISAGEQSKKKEVVCLGIGVCPPPG